MLIFWIFHFLLSLLISFCFYKLLSSKILGFIIAITVFGLLSGIWFIYPGSQNFAPILAILFLENTILESNGYWRLIRPFLISILLGSFLSIALILFKKRLGFGKSED